ncbi:MAG: penicillin-binding protein 2 [Deltaproteobacteria bacterium]|nr:penicillin-binding protein 2 [Deltaproteobacteria bacterium]
MVRLPRLINRAVPQRFRGYRPRVVLMLVFFLLLGSVLVGRAYHLQVMQHEELADIAQKQSQRTLQLKGRRGEILDRRGGRLALSLAADSFFAHPALVTEPALTAHQLARVLGLDAATLEARLRSDRGFVWIKRQVVPSESAAVNALDLPGIGSIEEYRRIYPWRELGAALLGFTGTDSKGLEGLEYAYNTTLSGSQAIRVLTKDALGRPVFTGEESILSPGGHIRLTLNPDLQYIAEQELSRAVDRSEALLGIALVMDSRTGEMLAVAQYPSFNPNAYSASDKETYANRAITYGYEPGSTLKILTAAIALEEATVKPDMLFFAENGQWDYYDATIHDTSKHGWLDLAGILRVSSNIGAAKLGLTIPRTVYREYLVRFGFGQRVGVFQDEQGNALAGEAEGYLPPVEKWTPVDQAAISFGHGVLVSPLQLAAAVNTIATGGLLLKPRVVLETRDARGAVVDQTATTVIRRVISTKTAAAVRDLMVQTISDEGGTGARAILPGFSVAGKTGTTELYDLKARGYSKTKHIASFVGFVPAENPRMTLVVIIDEPKKGRYGGDVAAPVFREISRRALPLLGVWPKDGVRRVQLNLQEKRGKKK